jgi:hypothetical protein
MEKKKPRPLRTGALVRQCWSADVIGVTEVGEEGFEPSRPFGHTDLNRARLPFRHPPLWVRRNTSTEQPLVLNPDTIA